MKKIKIPFLKPGNYIDMNSNPVSIDKSTLDKIIEATKSFAYQDDDFPLVIGHPKTDGPAWGWIKKTSIVNEDDVLVALADQEDVVPEFKDWFGKKLFKKVSVKLRPDFSIQHIGFLGAKPPAVTGLPAVAFKEDEKGMTIELADYELSQWYFKNNQRLWRSLKNFLISKFGKDDADSTLNEYDIEATGEPPAIFNKEPNRIGSSFASNNNSKTLTEEEEMNLAELNARVTELETQLTAKDTEITNLKNENKNVQTQLSAKVIEQKRKEFVAFCEGDDVKKKIKDGEKDELVEVMLALDPMKAIEFGEGDGKKSVTPVQTFQSIIKRLPDVVEMGEHTSHSNADTTDGVDVSEYDGRNVDKDRLAVHTKALALAAKEKISYEVALDRVLSK